MGDVRFTKVKWNGTKVVLTYEKPRQDGEPDEFSLSCGDRPTPEFIQAFDALAEDVIDICELPADQARQVSVRGLTRTYTNDIMGAVLTACKSLKAANAPLVLNTPHLPSEAYSGQESDPNPTLSGDTVMRIARVVEHAQLYLNGHRAQGSLLPAAPAA